MTERARVTELPRATRRPRNATPRKSPTRDVSTRKTALPSGAKTARTGGAKAARTNASKTASKTGAKSTRSIPVGAKSRQAKRPRGTAPSLALHVGVPERALPLSAARLRADVLRSLDLAGFRGAMSLAIVSDREMRRVNRDFHETDAPTDVLAFALGGGGNAGGPASVGRHAPAARSGAFDAEVIVSLDTARREARARGVDVAAELMLYVVHGTLHLLGHDDHDLANAAVMHRRTLAILSKLGYTNTISVGAHSA